MHFTTSLALFAASVSASTISVAVGQNGLTFTPNNFAAYPGDLVEFTFFPKNHSVIQSSFADPCHPLSSPTGGIFSGFVPTQAPGPNTNTFTIKITDTKPIWLYCGQTVGNHCQAGMVAAINAAPSGPKTFANFALLASNASTSTSPADGLVNGGVLGPKGAAGNATYTSKTITVTSEYEAPTTAVYSDASTTYTTTYLKTYQTTAAVETTYPVQSGAASSTQSQPSKSSGSASPSTSLTPVSGAAAMGASLGVVGAAAFGAAAWILL